MFKKTIFLLFLLTSSAAFSADSIVSTTVSYLYNLALAIMTITCLILGVIGFSLFLSIGNIVLNDQKSGVTSYLIIGFLVLGASTGSMYITVGVELGLVDKNGALTYSQGGSSGS